MNKELRTRIDDRARTRASHPRDHMQMSLIPLPFTQNVLHPLSQKHRHRNHQLHLLLEIVDEIRNQCHLDGLQVFQSVQRGRENVPVDQVDRPHETGYAA